MIRELQAPGDPDLLAEMIDAFLVSAPRHLEQVTQALADGDARRLADAAHALKSGAAYLGATELQQLCLELEKRGRAGVTTASGVLLAALQSAVAQAQLALAAEVFPQADAA